jgi:predicted nucleic acid-binding protein
MRRLLVDTSAIYALASRRDRNHGAARQFLTELLEVKARLVLADIVFAETMTLLRAHHGAAMAIRIGRELRQSALYEWHPTTTAMERATWGIFQKHDDKDWSYTDCAVLALAQSLGLQETFAFDAHFGQMPDLLMVPHPETSRS